MSLEALPNVPITTEKKIINIDEPEASSIDSGVNTSLLHVLDENPESDIHSNNCPTNTQSEISEELKSISDDSSFDNAFVEEFYTKDDRIVDDSADVKLSANQQAKIEKLKEYIEQHYDLAIVQRFAAEKDGFISG